MVDEGVMYCQYGLPYFSFLAFEQMRIKKEFCDVTLQIQHLAISAHRVILAAGIPYFRTLFANGIDQLGKTEISIADVEPSALESLVHFAYSSRVNISAKNARSLLLAAEFLSLTDVRDACVQFLSNRLHMYRVIEILPLAQHCKVQKLVENCHTYIQHNFEEFSMSKDFLSLSYPSLKDVISRGELDVSDEETVFEAVINWVKFSPAERQSMLPALLREIRMTCLSTEYLIKRITSEQLIRACSTCRDIIQDVQSFHLLPEKERSSLSLNTAPGRKSKKEIYAICNSDSRGCSIYRCNFETSSWLSLKSDVSHLEFIYHVAACREHIYVFLENTIKTFHVQTHQWEVLDAVYEHVSGSTVLNHGNLIYFFGSHVTVFFDKVRCFDTSQNKWLKEGKMDNGRANTAAASVKESIYVTGGYWDSEIFQIAEKYNPLGGDWCELPPMLTPRRCHGCASVKGKIFVFGGITKVTSLECNSNSGEVYDPAANMWTDISPMRSGRTHLSFVSHNRNIYAFGADTAEYEGDTQELTVEIEIYDPKFDQWNFGFRVPNRFIQAVVM